MRQLTLLGGMTLCLGAWAWDAAPACGQSVVPPGSTIAGKTIAAWTGDWWSWTYSMPGDQSPVSDETGAFANVNQSGDVFFIAGNMGGTSSRTFDVPANTPLLFPLVNVTYVRSPEPLDEDGIPVWSSGKPQVGTPAPAPADFVQGAVYGLIDQAVDLSALHLTIDGQSAADLGVDLTMHREQSGYFTAVVSDADNASGEPVGSWSDSVADGYWVMLNGLTPGAHTLRFGGGIKPGFFGPDAFMVDVSANIRAIPEPATGISLAMVAMLASLTRRQRFRQFSRQ